MAVRTIATLGGDDPTSCLSSLLCRHGQILIVDIETTGLNPAKDEVVEVAAILVREGAQDELRATVVLDNLVTLPSGYRIPSAVSALTGITDSMLAAYGVPRRQIAAQLTPLLLGNVLVVAHNVQFDMSFVHALLAKESFAVPERSLILDTLTVFRDRRSYPHTLADAISAYRLSVPVGTPHRALADARVVLRLLQAMAVENDDLLSYVNVIGYNPRYGVSGPRLAGVRYVPQPLVNHRRSKLPKFK
jgi:DNA polymerase-3 subunit epsilon